MRIDQICHLCNSKYGHPAHFHISYVNSETGDVDYAYVCPWCRYEINANNEVFTETRIKC